MRVRKFVFKFVNHGAKTMDVICFDVHSVGVIPSWQKMDIKEMAAWFRKHHIWEHNLKMLVKGEMEEYFRKNKLNGGIDIKDYILKKKKYFHQMTKVNIGQENLDNLNPEFKLTKLMEKIVAVYEHKTDVGSGKKHHFWDYKKNYVQCNYLIDDTKPEAELDEQKPAKEDLRILNCVDIFYAQRNRPLQNQNGNQNVITRNGTNQPQNVTALNQPTNGGQNIRGGTHRNSKNFYKYKLEKYKHKIHDLENGNF